MYVKIKIEESMYLSLKDKMLETSTRSTKLNDLHLIYY